MEMYRRTFLKGSLGLVATLTLPVMARAQTMSSTATQTAIETLQITLTDSGFELPDFIPAARYEVIVTNAGTLTESHVALGKIPDHVTDDEWDGWLRAVGMGEDGTDAFSWDDIGFVGLPDWPAPGGSVSGVVDLWPGRYFLFDPFAGREHRSFFIEGRYVDAVEPESDVTIDLHEMEIVVPEGAMTSEPRRWKIQNTGAMSHEVAVVPVPAGFTDDHLQLMFTLDEDATPPPGVPELVYQPAAAIGILAGGRTSWLDARLASGRYLVACMAPFGTGYPHAMDGMYRFIDVP